MQTGLVFHIQRYSIQDGPGIRTTVFLKGCPLACWWCHNPEGRSAEPEISVMAERCVRCGRCRQVCPRVLPDRDGEGPIRQRDGCTRCGQCVEACPADARQRVGTSMGVTEVLDQVLRDRIFFDDSGGGVTVSGGEPLLQARFTRALVEACRAEGVHAAVDTCGFAPPEALEWVAHATDLFLYDLKTLDDQLHRRHTGVSNALILENLQRLARLHQAIWIRVPLIPGFNDQPAQLDALARLAASIDAVRQVNLLPYHDWGLHKRRHLGQNNINDHESVRRLSAEAMQAAADRFDAVGIPVVIGG